MQCNCKVSWELSETLRMKIMMKSTNNFKFFDILQILTSDTGTFIRYVFSQHRQHIVETYLKCQ